MTGKDVWGHKNKTEVSRTLYNLYFNMARGGRSIIQTHIKPGTGVVHICNNNTCPVIQDAETEESSKNLPDQQAWLIPQ